MAYCCFPTTLASDLTGTYYTFESVSGAKTRYVISAESVGTAEYAEPFPDPDSDTVPAVQWVNARKMDIVLREKDAILYRDATNDEIIGIKIIPSDHAAFSLEILDFGYTHDLEDARDQILFESLPYDLMFTKPFFSEEESAALEGKTPTTSIKKADLIALLKKQDDYLPLVKSFVGDNPDYAERSAYLWQLTYAMFVRDAIAMDCNPFARYGGEKFVVVLVNSDATSPTEMAEQLRMRVVEQGLARDVGLSLRHRACRQCR